MALFSMRHKRQRNWKILLERETGNSVTVLNPAVSRYKLTNRGQNNHICYTIGNQMNRSQEFHPLKASSKVNATRTREQFVAGSSSRLPKIFPSSHSKESIFSLVEMYKARTTVTGHLPSKVLHSRAKSWKGKVPPSDWPTSSYNQATRESSSKKGNIWAILPHRQKNTWYRFFSDCDRKLALYFLQLKL